VTAQCDTASPDGFDVVLVNGGINDISPFHVVVANPFDPDGLRDLSAATRTLFAGPVTQLLGRTLERYAGARVVVLGYYPIVSSQSSGRALVQMMKHLPRPVGVRSAIDTLVEQLTDDAIDVAIAVEKKRMVEQCAAFYNISRDLLAGTVESLRALYGPRVFFADPGFAPENGFGAPATWLWDGSNDPQHANRVAYYSDKVLKEPFALPIYTPIASLCHPNALGSAAYAKAILATLA
jgi:hypothetical protein